MMQALDLLRVPQVVHAATAGSFSVTAPVPLVEPLDPLTAAVIVGAATLSSSFRPVVPEAFERSGLFT